MYMHLNRLLRMLMIKKELGEVYLNNMIESLAFSMISIFIPAYLLQLGFPLYAAIGFMAVLCTAQVLFSPVAGKIASYAGFKHTILYRAPVFISYLVLLIFIEAVPSMFLVAAVGGISVALYWVPLHGVFVRHTDKIRSGRAAGNLIGLPHMMTILAPTAAAIILGVLGFTMLFMTSIALIFVSVIPLFLSSDYREKASSLSGKRFLMSRMFSFYFFMNGLASAGEFIIWAVFIYLRFGTLMLGLVASLTEVGIMLLAIFFGRISSRMSRRKNMIRLGSLFYAMIWLARLFVSTPLEALTLSFLGGIATSLMWVPMYSLFCDFAKEKGLLDSVVFREVWISAARMTATGAIALVLFLTHVPNIFDLFFVAAAAASFLMAAKKWN
jgi:MFS family permease